MLMNSQNLNFQKNKSIINLIRTFAMIKPDALNNLGIILDKIQ